MIIARYALNGLPSSILTVPGIGNFPAFSGQLYGRNNPTMASKQEIGPIPPGRYFIVNRQSGGRLGGLSDFALKNIYGTDRSKWFALYKDDWQIDDQVFVEGVRRGHFRLHPIGPRGLSEGCITLLHLSDFDYLYEALMKTTMMPVPCTSFKAYGTITVT
ncbi:MULTISPECIES: DUF2778 domain-containing protein [Enterobacter]|uniref:DUF2778 domain-containing protein n=1 Tax=Enterobacter TaxID=547 RepID=UPI00084FB63B|nr:MULTISPECIES: DUF2778 domain-containing protein [Enterobacter]MEB6575611.1 DUF2778 domain-containing protein [Enterobacter quasiroggenkampii]OEI77040.1 hypothetical protein BFG58_00440 [Enterobacter sp. ku-bf2]